MRHPQQISLADRSFLEQHEIPLSKVFNAAGMKRDRYQQLMEQCGAFIAINTSPCKEAGHRIRTRSGHCVVCKPACISYIRRHEEEGYVYIAVSPKGRLVKVGTTADLANRKKNLNSDSYGQQSDWEIRHHVPCPKAGHYEFLVQKALAAYSVPGRYYHDGRWQDCYELFSCTEKVALEALIRLIPAPTTKRPISV